MNKILTKSNPAEKAVECCQCKRRRGKTSKPWRQCAKCKGVLCLFCAPACNPDPRTCGRCLMNEYDAKDKVRRSMPVQCRGCEHSFLPDEMTNQYVPVICKTCDRIVTNVRAFEEQEKRLRNAKPGLVEVCFGIFTPEKDGGRGYAYHARGLDLKLGDIVLLPPTWLDRDVYGKTENHEGTVVSTYSDYDGKATEIIKLVRRASTAT